MSTEMLFVLVGVVTVCVGIYSIFATCDSEYGTAFGVGVCFLLVVFGALLILYGGAAIVSDVDLNEELADYLLKCREYDERMEAK